jgi:hypothetical protein
VADSAASVENVPLRQSFNPTVEEDGATPHLSGRIEPITASAAPAPAATTPVRAPESVAAAPLATTPPQVPDRYQSFLPGPTDPFESAVERKAPQRGGSQPRYRRHVIRDGDTLAGLAERYLGDPARQNEILALNREALRASDVLPIGTVLRIPPAPASGSTAAPTSTSSPSPLAVPMIAPSPAEEPLVPVPAVEPAAAPVVSASAPVEPPIAVPAPADDGWRPAPAP